MKRSHRPLLLAGLVSSIVASSAAFAKPVEPTIHFDNAARNGPAIEIKDPSSPPAVGSTYASDGVSFANAIFGDFGDPNFGVALARRAPSGPLRFTMTLTFTKSYDSVWLDYVADDQIDVTGSAVGGAPLSFTTLPSSPNGFSTQWELKPLGQRADIASLTFESNKALYIDNLTLDDSTPTTPGGGTVPEPAGMTLAGLALAGLFVARRRRHTA